ncbi:energy transducer TonB [Mucilaginibacter sp.]
MKPKLLLICLLLTGKIFGQTKVVVVDGFGRTEVYNVLQADSSVREGEYTRFISRNNQAPLVVGRYHQNVKDSTWKYYSGANRVAEGNYRAGLKVGVWTGYARGAERLKFDFTTQKLILFTPAAVDTSLKVSLVGDNTNAAIERRPMYLSGLYTLANFLMRGIRPPAMLMEARKGGEVLVSVMVDENGKATNYSIRKKFGFGVDEEVLRVFNLSDGEWTPGSVNGKATAMVVEIPVVFEINKPDDEPHKPNQIVIIRSSFGR